MAALWESADDADIRLANVEVNYHESGPAKVLCHETTSAGLLARVQLAVQ